jgi:hypothetical protein
MKFLYSLSLRSGERVGVWGYLRKEGSEKMTATQFNTSSTHLHRILAALWQKYGFFCFSSYPPQNCPHYLSQLISSFTNRIQREFLFNNCIQSQKFCHAQKFQPKCPIFFKHFQTFLRVLYVLRSESAFVLAFAELLNC